MATVGEEFLTDARVRVRVPNFPQPGETTWFEWNEATQHLEMTGTIYLEDVCDELIREYVIPQGSADTPLLEPPPLPCLRDRQGDLDGEYFVQFVPDQGNTTRVCQAVRGTTSGRIREGKISMTTRSPPTGVSGFPARSVTTASTSDHGQSTVASEEFSPAAWTVIVAKDSGRTLPAVRNISDSQEVGSRGSR